MSDLSIRKTAVMMGVQIIGVLVVGELLAAAFMVIYLSSFEPDQVANALWSVLLITLLAKTTLQSYIIALLSYNWTSNRYIIRGHHLIMRHKLLAQDDKMYELSNLQNIHVHQSWLGRLCNFGTLELAFTMPGRIFSVFLQEVHNPRRYRRIFEEHFVAGTHSHHPSILHPEMNIPYLTDGEVKPHSTAGSY